jgi:hypothetical protein
MDLGVYLRVLWRFKILVAIGLVVASVLAINTLVRVEFRGGKPTVSYRADEVWESAATLFVTQQGFPWGRAILDEVVRIESGTAEPQFIPRYGDPGRYSGLAALYAELAKSDAVQRQVMRTATREQRYEAELVKAPDGSTSLPLVSIKGYGPSPRAAQQVAIEASDAFRRYLAAQQLRNGIPADKRVVVFPVRRASPPVIFESRSFVQPIFIFLLVLMVFIALAFVLENLRPRVRPPAAAVRSAKQLTDRARRTA